jgi:hypothetical protein
VTTLAVDQDQRVVGAEPAQGSRERQVGGVAAECLEVERRKTLRKDLGQILLADILERTAAQKLDRSGAVRSGTGGARTGYNNVACDVGAVTGVASAAWAATGRAIANAVVVNKIAFIRCSLILCFEPPRAQRSRSSMRTRSGMEVPPCKMAIHTEQRIDLGGSDPRLTKQGKCRAAPLQKCNSPK